MVVAAHNHKGGVGMSDWALLEPFIFGLPLQLFRFQTEEGRVDIFSPSISPASWCRIVRMRISNLLDWKNDLDGYDGFLCGMFHL